MGQEGEREGEASGAAGAERGGGGGARGASLHDQHGASICRWPTHAPSGVYTPVHRQAASPSMGATTWQNAARWC